MPLFQPSSLVFTAPRLLGSTTSATLHGYTTTRLPDSTFDHLTLATDNILNFLVAAAFSFGAGFLLIADFALKATFELFKSFQFALKALFHALKATFILLSLVYPELKVILKLMQVIFLIFKFFFFLIKAIVCGLKAIFFLFLALKALADLILLRRLP